MDSTKKRKLDEDGFNGEGDYLKLYPADARKMIERFAPDRLIDILQDAVVRHPDVLSAVRSVADLDESQRTLFIRGLGLDTTTDGLRSLFSTFGDLEETVVILNKGYGFVTFCHVDSALLALREPSKRIDGGFAIAAGNSGSNTNAADIAIRKVYVYNVPTDLPAEKLLAHFSIFGEIEEGPLGFDKETGKSKGFALFVYKTPEGARAALKDPVNNVDGRRLIASCPFSLEVWDPLKDFPYSHGSSALFLEIYRKNSPFLSPRVDSKETPEAHVFKVDLPGLKMEEVKLETEGDGVLQISGERSTGTEKEDKNERWHCVERSNGMFMRRFRLPEYVKMDQVKVAMENCVLTVTVPKVEIKEPDGYQNQHHPPSGVSPVPRVPPGSMYPNVPPYY